MSSSSSGGGPLTFRVKTRHGMPRVVPSFSSPSSGEMGRLMGARSWSSSSSSSSGGLAIPLLPLGSRKRVGGQRPTRGAPDRPMRTLHSLEGTIVLEEEGQEECLLIRHTSNGVDSATSADEKAPADSTADGMGVQLPGTEGGDDQGERKAEENEVRGGRVCAELISRERLAEMIEKDPHHRTQKIEAIFGVYNLSSGPHLAVITQSKTVFSDLKLGGGTDIRQVSEISMWHIRPSSPGTDASVLIFNEKSMEMAARAHATDMDLLRIAFSSHQLYFSPSMGSSTDVTHALQRSLDPSSECGHDWRLADRRFFWNWGLTEPLRVAASSLGRAAAAAAAAPGHKEGSLVDGSKGEGFREPMRRRRGAGGKKSVRGVDRWITPVMSGFVDVVSDCEVGGCSFDLLFVSRRSVFRQGTRYTRRGIDADGNVANFVETEQAILHHDGVFTSHIQIRGSIPLFWSSPVNLAYHPPVQLETRDEENVKALSKHVENLSGHYGSGFKLVFVNLVDKKKSQGRLGEAFDSVLTTARERSGLGKSAQCEHVWFDFHEETRTKGYGRLADLLEQVDSVKSEEPHGFFQALTDGTVVSRQEGMVRTNCMDCLDRTNVVQSLIARRSLLAQLKAAGADVALAPPEDGGENDTSSNGGAAAVAFEEADTVDSSMSLPSWLTLPSEDLEKAFRNVWGNNADEMSVLYAGTPALKSDITRTGRRTKLGLFMDGANSALRYIMNNFYDHKRQEAVDMLLGIRDGQSQVGEGFWGEEEWEGPGSAASRSEVRGWRPRLPVDLDLWARMAAPEGTALEGTIQIGIRPRLLQHHHRVIARGAPADQKRGEAGALHASPKNAFSNGMTENREEAAASSPDSSSSSATATSAVESSDQQRSAVLSSPGGFYVGTGPQAQYVSLSVLAMGLLCVRAASSGPALSMSAKLAALVAGLIFFPLIQMMRDTP